VSGIIALAEATVPDPSVIAGNYLRDILDQPRALENTLAALKPSPQLEEIAARLRNNKFRRIVLTGMGSSFHVLHPLNLFLIEHGFTALMVETSELIHYQGEFIDHGSLIIAVSQSGRSAEAIRLLEMKRTDSSLIGVTNTEDSPLATRPDAVVLTRAGQEFSVSCKTYVASLMALHWIGPTLCGEDPGLKDLQQAAPAVASYLSDWKSHVQSLVNELKDAAHLFLVGRGASLATVGTGALTIKESDHFHAEGMSSAAFRHGPFEMLSSASYVLVFSGDDRTADLNKRLHADIRQHGGRSEMIGSESALPAFRLPSVPDSIRPIVEILPVQMITLALAAQRGREAGKFERATKVTATE
jgi:glutamine---fructose-6-phosphate transaminase (isomerizing)